MREQSFFLELLNKISYQSSVIRAGAVNLGGTSGSGGGNGSPPGGFYGLLPQSRVAGDTTESFDYTSGSAVSLLSNLNNLRAYAEPATWFFAHETIPASQSLTIMPGLWHFSSGSVLQTTQQDYTFVPPASMNRIDLLYVHTSGVYDVIRGTAAISPIAPSIPAPTSGSMPLAYVYLRSSGSALHNVDRGENYVSQDLRPFINWGLGGSEVQSLDPSTPQPVGSSGSVGTSGSAAHGDHVHQGVTSLNANGGTKVYGDINLVSGTNMTITRSSGSIVFSSTGSGGSGGGISSYESDYASPPLSPVEGDLWFISDGLLNARRGASDWSYYYGTFKVTKPVASDFTTWFNQGSATFDDYGQIVLYTPGAGTNLRGKVMSTPGGSYTLDAVFIPGVINNPQWMGCGLVWSDGTKYTLIGTQDAQGGAGNPGFEVGKWNTTSSYSAAYTLSPNITSSYPWRSFSGAFWVRLKDDGANRYVYISHDWGKHFQQLLSVDRTDFLTPTQVGICVYSDSTVDVTMSLIHWTVS